MLDITQAGIVSREFSEQNHLNLNDALSCSSYLTVGTGFLNIVSRLGYQGLAYRGSW